MRNASLAVALLLGSALPANAQIFDAVGTRAQGMGGAFVAVADDATATWWNPAGLATGKLFSLVVDAAETTDPAAAPDTGPARRDKATGFSVAFPGGAFSYYRFRVSEIGPPGPTDPGAPDREDPGSDEVLLRAQAISQYGLTVGQSIGGHLVLGTTIKLLRAGESDSIEPVGSDPFDRAEDLEVSTETTTALDVGAMAALGRLRLGISVKHFREPEFGEGEDAFVLPRQARAGVAFLTQTSGALNALTVAADMDVTSTQTVNGDVRRLATGVEVWLANRKLGARAGLSLNTIGQKKPTGSVGVTLGSTVYLDAALLFGADDARNGFSVGVSTTF